jgi:hypothetical protein
VSLLRSPTLSPLESTTKHTQRNTHTHTLKTLSGPKEGSLSRGSSLANLSAYLALQRAEEVYGFEPERYGLTEAEAADIAGVFSRFDVNDDGRLEQSELRTLWCAAPPRAVVEWGWG